MTALDVLRRAAGATHADNVLAERLELLLEQQAAIWRGSTGGWIISPLAGSADLYLISMDREGQRRGREVLRGFLGPAVAELESLDLAADAGEPGLWLIEAGFRHASRIRRTGGGADDLLDRLEDAVATLASGEHPCLPNHSSYVDHLRDFRLALHTSDASSAERSLTELRRTGRLSAENERFLQLEFLGALGRWRELADLPFIADLIRTRRPRVVNEFLLECLWWTELSSGSAVGAARQVFAESNLIGRFGSVLSAVDVPRRREGRATAVLAAHATDDVDRVRRIVAAAADQAERTWLENLAPKRTADVAPADNLGQLYDQGQYGRVIELFLSNPSGADADVAVQATVDLGDSQHAKAMLETARATLSLEGITPDRRLRRDLTELARLADGACTGWEEWCSRVAADTEWADAERVLRSEHDSWAPLADLPAGELRTAADQVLEGWVNANRLQVVASLDLLCQAAETTVGRASGYFAEVLLEILSAQENLSPATRDAYLQVLAQLLDHVGVADYRNSVDQALALWRAVASVHAVDWGLSLVELVVSAPCPDDGIRRRLIHQVLGDAAAWVRRLNLRQRSELIALAEENDFPLPLMEQADASGAEESVWARLNGALIGVYSMQPNVVGLLRRRLAPLCTPAGVEGNDDKVATDALRAMVRRVDYLVVDTRHAAHAATGAIDDLVPKSEQILPGGGGVSAYLRALEAHLEATPG